MSISQQDKPPAEQANVTSYLRAAIHRIRRGGVPHEETVIIPAVAVVSAASMWVSGWPIWIPEIALAVITFACGAWLGLAWRGYPMFRVLLRPFYFSALAVLLYLLTHNEPVSKREGVHVAVLIISTLGPLYYFGYIYAALVRDVAIRRFSSEKQRRQYLERMAWWRYVWRLARDKEDKSQAADWDFFVSRLLASCMDVKALIAIFGVCYSIWIVARTISAEFRTQ